MIDTSTTEGKIEVMAAFAAGKTIEARERRDTEWRCSAMAPRWDWVEFDYRIAPEPLEFHVVVNRRGKWVYAYTDINAAHLLAQDMDVRRDDCSPHRVILVREVLP